MNYEKEFKELEMVVVMSGILIVLVASGCIYAICKGFENYNRPLSDKVCSLDNGI